MPMRRLTAISALGLVLLGCESGRVSKPSSSQRESDARAVFQRFQTSLKDKNTDDMAACLTDGGTKTFFDLWQRLMNSEEKRPSSVPSPWQRSAHGQSSGTS
jgi:hypothetical protein